MTRIMRLSLTVICLTLAVGALAADWPNFMGPDAKGIAPDTGINKDWAQKPPKQLWQTQLGDNGYAGMSAADGKVFIVDHAGGDDVVRAIDLASGKDLWNYKYADNAKENYGYARATPAYAQGKVYTLGRFGMLHCLDADSGSLIWSKDIKAEFGGQVPQWNYTSSPIVDGDVVIVQPGGQTGMVALNTNNGSVIWTGGSGGTTGYAPAQIAEIQGGKQYVSYSGEKLYGADPASGKVLWSVPWTTKYGVNAAVPLVVGNFVFAASGYGYGCALYEILPTGPKQHWQNRDLSPHFNSPIYYNKCFFGLSDRTGLVCMNPKDGSILWQTGDVGEKGGLVAVDETLIGIHDKSGKVVMVSNDWNAYKKLGEFNGLGGQSWSPPIVADGKLIIRNQKAMACYDLM